MDDKQNSLCNYRIENALETFETAKWCVENRHYKDAINRSYYAAFYAAKAILALEKIDFKRHKDVVSYFNKHYVATEKVPRSVGKCLAELQRKRENSDYDDFFIASFEEAEKQLESAKYIIDEIQKFINKNIL